MANILFEFQTQNEDKKHQFFWSVASDLVPSSELVKACVVNTKYEIIVYYLEVWVQSMRKHQWQVQQFAVPVFCVFKLMTLHSVKRYQSGLP